MSEEIIYIDKPKLHALRAAIISRPKDDLIMDYKTAFVDPFLYHVHDDRAGLEGYLQEISVEELDDISGVFYAIYDKWTDERMYDLLKSLEKKIEKYYKGKLGLQ